MQNKKYPRTFHFRFSPEVHSDDKVQYDLTNIIGKEVVVLLKLDGGNCTLKTGGPFARSVSEKTVCPSFNYIKGVHQSPKEWDFQGLNYHGENMFAKHSIFYDKLDDFFYLFGVSDKENFLSWDDVVFHSERLNFQVVPEIERKVFSSESELHSFLDSKINDTCPLGGDAIEGFVVRSVESFKITDFSKHVVKYVRNGHVQTDEHWSKNWILNKLKKDTV